MQVWRVPVAGGMPEPLTDGGYTAQVDYSPDGTALVYQRHDGVGFDIYVVPSAGGVASQLTTGEADDGSPRWSPNGASVAFLSGPPESRLLQVMSAAGDGATPLTNAAGAVGGYDWLPDGSGLVYSLRESRANIWRAEVSRLLGLAGTAAP